MRRNRRDWPPLHFAIVEADRGGARSLVPARLRADARLRHARPSGGERESLPGRRRSGAAGPTTSRRRCGSTALIHEAQAASPSYSAYELHRGRASLGPGIETLSPTTRRVLRRRARRRGGRARDASIRIRSDDGALHLASTARHCPRRAAAASAVALTTHALAYAAEQGYRAAAHELAGHESRRVPLLAGARLRARAHPARPPACRTLVIRVPLLSGTRLVVATAPDDASCCARRRPADAVADVGPPSATRCGSRSRASGSRRSRAAGRARRSSSSRRRCRFPARRTTRASWRSPRSSTSSSGSASRPATRRSSSRPGSRGAPSQRELESLVTPELARRFHGHVVVHDVEDPELVAARRRRRGRRCA